MDGIGARHLGDADDLLDAQVGRDRTQPFTDPVGLVRLEAMEPQFILFGVNGDGLLAHLVRGAHDPDGDLAPVRNQDFLEFGHWHPLGKFVARNKRHAAPQRK